MHFRKSLLLAALAGGASALPAAAATLLVPQQYPTIQKAVNAARPGDTVQVTAKPRGGVYHEAVTIRTPGLTLQGVNNPVIDGTGLAATVTVPYGGTYTTPLNDIDIQAAHVTVSGLTVQNSGAAGVNVGSTAANGFDEVSFSDIAVGGCTLRGNAQGATLAGFTGSPYAQYGIGAPVVYLKGYKFTGNTVTGNAGVGSGAAGASVAGSGAVVSGNCVAGNGTAALGYGGDGLTVTGDGLTVTGNECSGNGVPHSNYGLSVTGPVFNPAAKAHPDPSTVALNAVHDNTGAGLYLKGTLLASGNVVDRNTAYGLLLDFADFSVVSGNSVTRTASGIFGQQDDISTDDGAGIYALEGGYSTATGAFAVTGPATISLNQVSGNAGDGIDLAGVDDAQVSGNSVTGNGQVGIHVSDFTTNATPKLPGNVISYNYAQGNALFDAQDDATGVHTFPFPGYQDGLPSTPNVWTHNVFGTTDPKTLSH